jgi:hypothetical protein
VIYKRIHTYRVLVVVITWTQILDPGCCDSHQAIACSRGWIQTVQSSIQRPGSKISIQVITTTYLQTWAKGKNPVLPRTSSFYVPCRPSPQTGKDNVRSIGTLIIIDIVACKQRSMREKSQVIVCIMFLLAMEAQMTKSINSLLWTEVFWEKFRNSEFSYHPVSRQGTIQISTCHLVGRLYTNLNLSTAS